LTPLNKPSKQRQHRSRIGRGAALALVVAVGALLWLVVLPAVQGPADLVVYCAHDAVYSEQILREFERSTGISIAVRFDTEATKSLGLVQQIRREKDNRRCDVFWNNELLGTLDLQDAGLLEPYQGSGYERIATAYKDPQGYWAGFAARLRVWIINTDRHAVSHAAIEQTLAGADLSNVTLAKPLFGTTRTHYTVLWDLWGEQRFEQWHRDGRQRGLIEAQSNGKTKGLVAAGTCAIGWTDTDDFFVAKDAGQPVAMLPVKLADQQVICIPNTVAIIKGTQQRDLARQLVDYLLSEQVELALARSKSRQIPLGPVDQSKLSDDVKPLMQWVGAGYPLASLGSARRACLAWLESEYLK
jgi:iron(III) transport system substrate-binding protein